MSVTIAAMKKYTFCERSEFIRLQTMLINLELVIQCNVLALSYMHQHMHVTELSVLHKYEPCYMFRP
jgi:hypothetical protein